MGAKFDVKVLTRNKVFLAGLIILFTVAVVAVFADAIAPHPYDEMNVSLALRAPQPQFPFGTDQYGRCVFSRVIYGTRIALGVGLVVVLVESLIGVTLGLLAGYYGKKFDKIVMFVTDLTWALPPLVMALAIVTMLGPSLINVVIAIAAVSWAQFARIVRAKTQALKNMPFVEAARAFGEGDLNIILRYILPNVLSPIIVLSTLSLPQAILSTTSLGFLGLGAQPPSPDWGLILSEGKNYIRQAPWISIFPGIALVYTVLGFNLLGEGLREILDPRLKL
ncbi:Glutathione transport system permease protein GsiD [Fervidicola ferrireducens]|uniref:Glutathione transport system permease protein GsiD n=1 Tax=Fervidicola ferrireducens TaxID=520764 RepID=A0A140LDB5_9FIRM|nr:ABC transporter permease [Fervidicola ferrireducens]KXG78540.1 Glutathione transport system permease protein GsiD [Fervidicola ferrireducens]